MDNKMKYRIIGIGVLVLALAVIIVPLFFGRSEKGPKLSAHIPNPPGKPETQLAIPTVPQDSTENSTQTANANLPSSDLATNSLQTSTSVSDTAAASNNSPADGTVNSASENEATATTVSTPAAATVPTAKANKTTREPRNKSGAIKPKYAEKHKRHHEHLAAPKLKSAELAQAWTVQLASFTQKANAEILIKRLRAKGFPAYLHEAKTGKEPVLRVFVGPELRREKAQQLVERLRTEFGMRGLVVKYRV